MNAVLSCIDAPLEMTQKKSHAMPEQMINSMVGLTAPETSQLNDDQATG